MSSTRPADPARLPARIFALGGLLCLAVLTLLDRGATRQFSTPWSTLLWFAELAPFAVLLLRANSGSRPFVLPGRTWCLGAALCAGGIVASALVSPYRGTACLNALPLLAGLAAFFCLHDWLHHSNEDRSAPLITAAGLAALLIATVSLFQWLATLVVTPDKITGLASLLIHRNDHPLGHSNYTAGLALLALPWPATLALRSRGLRRAAWLVVTALVLLMLFTSGSRGGLLGLAVLAAGAVLWSGLGWKKILLLSCAAAIAALALAFAHPRTRAMLFRKPAAATATASNVSDVQRNAMVEAGMLMGFERPLFGWGPGTTPLVYPYLRAALSGGTENVLQLHSTPLQLWAELGAPSIIAALAALVLVVRGATRCRPAFLAFLGYAAFALTDWQLDLPIFAFALAVCAALLAPPAQGIRRPRLAALFLSAAAAAALLCIGVFGQRDRAPALNLRALALARDPAQADRAAALFRESLALNRHQEIAHFNLGWLLVTRDPAEAETHFVAAAHLVPDKGGVYFGLALARLNAGRPRDTVVRALAVECLNDPLFLSSPWWREPSLHALQADTFRTVVTLAEAAGASGLVDDLPATRRELAYVAALTRWLGGEAIPGEPLAHANTGPRVSYFARRPAVPDFSTGPVRAYHRERTGYPVLMRDLDLPVPVDLYDVQENVLAATELSFLFPAKGWLPTPLLPALLAPPAAGGE
ncbi:MAG: O-antigen ligase family protein [Verrucomicrobia bacterium]|nr:O-antigen ligase family protein [Verrucomicrobiota bacterium]